jgi:hypothetical protein
MIPFRLSLFVKLAMQSLYVTSLVQTHSKDSQQRLQPFAEVHTPQAVALILMQVQERD